MKTLPANPARAAFWARVRQHSRPVNWSEIAPAPVNLIKRNAQARAIKAAGV